MYWWVDYLISFCLILLQNCMLERMMKDNIISSSQDSAGVVRSSRDEKPLHYTLKIQSFSLLKAAVAKSNPNRYESQTFHVAGYKWKLGLYPTGDEKRNGSGHISLYLINVEDDQTLTSDLTVVVTFLVYDNFRDKYLAIRDGKIRVFHSMKKEWGFEKLMSLETFNDPSNGFLVDDCCAFGVDIFVKKCEWSGEVLSFVKEPKDNRFTWNRNDFSQLDKASYESNPFAVEGYRWKMVLYPKGLSKASSGGVSLFLKCDSLNELPRGSQVYVEFEMAILSQLGEGPRRGEFKCWFRSGDVDIEGGLSSNFKEPKNGFISNDNMIFEVKINVVSTKKSL